MSLGGVRFLDHTADVGFDISAPTPEDLLDAAARAMLVLLRGEEDVPAGVEDAPSSDPAGPAAGLPVERRLELAAPDSARLMADWLREILFLHEIDRLDYEAAAFDALELTPPCRLAARVRLRTGGHAVREIKGVTYHEIEARRAAEGWTARVIFDV